MNSASIIQEYHKVQDLWATVESDKKCKLAIWVVDYEDVEIVAGFMGIEASPIGTSNDIIFHFTTEYKGDDDKFEEQIFKEYISWFDKPDESDIDILEALKNDKLLLSDYYPNSLLKPTFKNLWAEMLRLKSCIRGIEQDRFCAYFQLPHTDALESTSVFKEILEQEIPDGIRIATIDYKDNRKIKIKQSDNVTLLQPKLKMKEAIQNEMNRGAFSNNTVGAEGRYRKLIISILNKSQHGKSTQLDKEIEQLFSVSKEMGSLSTIIGSYLIASQAYYYVRDNDKCMSFSEKAISESEKNMHDKDSDLYPIWRGAIMLQAAIHIGNQKRDKAIELYLKMAQEATKRADAYYIMEGYRLIGHLYYELGNLLEAFENTLLALAAGSYLGRDMMRQSTFLQAANLALYLVERVKGYDSIKIIEDQLEEWLGDDWRSLVENETMAQSQIRHKASIIDRIKAN